MPDASVPASAKSITAAQRNAILDERIAQLGGMGYRVETRGSFEASLVKGNPPERPINARGPYALVAAVTALLNREKRKLVAVDDVGNITVT